VGCERFQNVDAQDAMPAELKQPSDYALKCLADAQYVSIENSEHCVVVAESILTTIKDECLESDSDECKRYDSAYSRVYQIYHKAIIRSLMMHGRSAAIREVVEEDGIMAEMVFIDGERMRQMFDACLENEVQSLAASGLQRVTSLVDFPPVEGQLCIREGYPEFKTEKF
jgi:hypothetical protein